MKYIILLLSIITYSCTSTKLIRNKTKNLGLEVLINEDGETIIFTAKNNSNKPIQFPSEMWTLNNILEIYSPSDIQFKTYNSSGSYGMIQPNGKIEIKIKHFDLFLLHDLKAKDTGNYRCVWKNETHNFEIEFEYYFDYEKTKIKYKLEDL